MLSSTLDELNAALETTTEPHARIDILNKIAYQIETSDTEKSFPLFRETYQAANALTPPYKRGLADSLAGQARIYRHLGQYDRAFGLALEAQVHYVELNVPEGLYRVHQTLAAVYWHIGNFSHALTAVLEGLEIAKGLQAPVLLAESYEGLGVTYFALEEKKSCLKALKSAWEYEQQTEDNNNHRRASILNNLALAYGQQGAFEKAIAYAKQSLHYCHLFGEPHAEANILDTLGSLYVDTGELEKGLSTYWQAVDLARKVGAKFAEAGALHNIGQVHQATGDLEQAAQVIQQALAIADAINARSLQYQGFENLAQIYEVQGDLESALRYFKLFSEVKEAVYREQNEDKIKTLEMIHRKEEEARLYQEKNRALEAEIRQRQKVEKALVQAKEEAEVANQAKSDFLSRMSHELRTPLAGILGYAELLQFRAPDEQGFAYQAAEIIQESGQHLLILINDILDLAKIEAQKVELMPTAVSLASFWTGIEGILSIQAQSKDISLVLDIADDLPEIILADPTRLRQVLVNLLGNGIKFTQQGGVTLRVSQRPYIADYKSCRLLFEIIDTGIGISKDNLARIFQPFEQVSNGRSGASGKQQGTGLGLAISQQLIRAMGSDIQVESTPNQGSRFWFELTFPIVELARQTQLIKEQLNHIIGYEGTRRHLLIIDDIAHNHSLLQERLTPLGFIVHMAADSKQGQQLAQQLKPDLIFIDLMLPNIEGVSLTDTLSEVDAILVGTSADIAISTMQSKPPFAAFLSKPFIQEDLFSVLQSTLSLQWQYTPSAESAPLVRPTQNELNQLLELVQMGDLLTLKETAQKLQNNEPALAPFCQHLIRLANRFAESELTSFLTDPSDILK